MTPFPLQAVLGYRKNIEDVAQLALSRARQEYLRIEHRMDEERKRQHEVRQELDRCQSRGTDAMTLVLYQQCLEGTARNLHQLQRELEKAEQDISNKKNELYEACKDKKKLEKLRDRHDQRSREEESRLETVHLDEVAVAWSGRSW